MKTIKILRQNNNSINKEQQYSLPVLVRAYNAASVLERHGHFEPEISEPAHQKVFHLLLTIQHRQEHLLMAHCTAQREKISEGNIKEDD